MAPPTVGSLFAGIGGFDLGFERAGFRTSWQVEIDPWCRKVLAKHFPHAERYADVRECGAHNLSQVDVVVGGFPCQDISNAGLRAGIEGERSGLWGEFARIIGELRPRFILVENVAALLGRGMGRVLGDLAALGYDAEWEIVSAADVGAPHLRERVWILAYPGHAGVHKRGRNRNAGQEVRQSAGTTQYELQGKQQVSGQVLADAPSERCGEARELRRDQSAQWTAGGREAMGYPESLSGNGARESWPGGSWAAGGSSGELAYADSDDAQGQFTVSLDTQGWQGQEQRPTGPRHAGSGGQWAVEPNVGRVAHGVPRRVDRLRGLGNSVVPQIPELFARRIREVL